MPKKRGRSTRVANGASTRLVSFKTTPAEHREIGLMAEALGLTRSDFCRAQILNQPFRIRPVVPAANLDLYAELARPAANLNQIARHLNENRITGRITTVTLEQLKTCLDEVAVLLHALRIDLLGDEP